MKLFKKFTLGMLLALGAHANPGNLGMNGVLKVDYNPEISFFNSLDTFNFENSENLEYHVSLDKKNLDQKFLLSTAQIRSAPAVTGSAMANKVVFFEKRANDLYMFEDTRGKLITASIGTKILLAKFPIVKESEDKIIFNFEKGMSQVYLRGSMYVSDYPSDSSDHVLNVQKSYINKVESRGKYIFIDQLVRGSAKTSPLAGEKAFNVQFKYTFSKYAPNPNFKPKKSSKNQKVGYFEVHPSLDPNATEAEKSQIINILKFPTDKQLTWHLSRNIPEDYKQAVIDGVLYWNKTFGKEFIKVDTLPEGVSIHEPGYHIVQWLKWDTAGFAYADIQGDPLTGENLQSHIYMTSVFSAGGLKAAERYLKTLLANKDKVQTPETNSFLAYPNGFQHKETCRFNHREALIANASSLLEETKDLTDEEKNKIYKRFAADYVREVVAHEIGHTLGLRHNFAGTASSSIDPQIWKTLSKAYFLTGELPEGTVPSSSVMDYTPSMVAAMMGGAMRLGHDAFPYDKAAIDWGYTDKKLEDIEFPVFCTDSHLAKGAGADCKVWDRFADTITDSVLATRGSIQSLPTSLALKFEFLKKDSTEDRLKKIRAVKLNPAQDLVRILANYSGLLKTLSKDANFVKIMQKYEDYNTLYVEDYRADVKKYQKETVKSFGDLAEILLTDFTPTEEKEIPVIKTIKETLEKNMENLYGWKMSEAEKELVKKQFARYFHKFERELLLGLTKTLKTVKFGMKDQSLAGALNELADRVLFLSSEKEIAQSPASTPIYSPLFEYRKGKESLRKEVISLLANNFYPLRPSYMRKVKKSLKALYTKHQSQVKGILGGVSRDDVSDEVYDFIHSETILFFPLSKIK